MKTFGIVWLAAALFIASAGVVSGQYSYAINSGNTNTITITGYTGTGGVVNITNKINGLTVSCIGQQAFAWLSNLTSVIIPNSVTSIGLQAFDSSSLTNVIIGNGITSIGDWAFSSCGLTSVTIPNSVTNMGYAVFYGCGGLTNAIIGSSVTNIGGDTFDGCGLTSVIIGNSVISIGGGAFQGCSLTSITIPSSVTYIEDLAFFNCFSLTSVYFKGNAPGCGGPDVFFGEPYNEHPIIYYVLGTTGWGSVFEAQYTAIWTQQLTVTANPSQGGSVTGSGTYAVGMTVPISATASNHWSFTSWNNGNTNNPYTVMMPESNITYAANFAIDEFKLVVSSKYCTGGCVPATGTNVLDYGVMYCAVTNAPKILSGSTTQYVCTGWTGTGDLPNGSGTNTYPFTLDQNTSITWLWQTNYWLSTTTNGNGSVDVASQWCNLGTNVVVTAMPSAFNWFTGWHGQTNGCIISGNTISVVMNATHAITAYFNGDQVSSVNFGVRSNKFGFNITGTSNLVIEVEACTDLIKAAWSPVGTNKLTNGTSYFVDSKWTNYPCRFYRLIAQ